LENFEMKKTLVAVAALTAITGAMAEVSITGLLDVAATVNGTSSTLGAGPNGGSEFTLGVKEDLGNGISAIGAYTIHGDVLAGSGGTDNTFRSYNSYVGLAGDFGSIKLGSNWSPMFLASTISDVTGRWNSSSLANPAELQNANSVTYTSPSISGFSFSLQQQMATAGDYATSNPSIFLNQTGGGAAQAWSINYSNGALNAAYASSKGSLDSAGTAYATQSSILAASYNLGVATVHYANLITDNATNGTNVTSNGVGISAPIGESVVVGAQWSSNNAATAVTEQSYVATYNLSKRTAVYAGSYLKSTDSSATTQIGLKHAF